MSKKVTREARRYQARVHVPGTIRMDGDYLHVQTIKIGDPHGSARVCHKSIQEWKERCKDEIEEVRRILQEGNADIDFIFEVVQVWPRTKRSESE